jgi:hypothetical protein
MRDLIFRVRTELLKRNLRQVERVIVEVRERQKELKDFSDFLQESVSKILSLAGDVHMAIGESSTRLEDSNLEEEFRQYLINILEQGDQSNELVRSKLRDMRKNALAKVQEMQSRSVQIEENVKGKLGSEATDWIHNLEQISEKKKQAEEKEKSDPKAAAELMQKVWGEDFRNINKNSQRIFEEYIDFLGGLALRDTNVDLGICQIADALVQKWVEAAEIEWRSLTIPTRQDRLEMSLAHIIRLGFPEWTIWALPLIAYSFGQFLIESDKLENWLITETPSDDRGKVHMRNFLADAFATYAMGPAYVSAAVLLRFDPLTAYEDQKDQPASAKRAHVLFTMLRRMNEDSGKDYVYEDVIKQLEEEWTAALLQVQPPGALLDEDQKQLERWVNDLWAYLNRGDDTNYYLKYPGTSWGKLQGWYEQLLQGKVEDINVNDTTDLRDVLNAAWLCRIEQPDKTEEIAKSAIMLWERTKEPRREPTRTSVMADTREFRGIGGMEGKASLQGSGESLPFSPKGRENRH